MTEVTDFMKIYGSTLNLMKNFGPRARSRKSEEKTYKISKC